MSEVAIRLGHHTVAITLPDHLLRDGVLNGLKNAVSMTAVDERIVVSEDIDHTFAFQIGSRHREAGLKRGALLERILEYLAGEFAELARVPVFRAAAVSWNDGAVLIAGPEGSGKSSLAAWFIENGFAFIADNQVAVLDGNGSLAGYSAPLAFSAIGASHLVELSDFGTAPMARTGERIHIGIKDSWSSSGESYRCGMIIFPHHVPDSPARLEKLEVSTAALLLKAQLTSSRAASSEMNLWYIEMARDIPAVALYYSHYDQIEGLLDRLVKLAIDDRMSPDSFNRFMSGIGRPASTLGRKYPIPERSDRKFSPFMTIGMATFDDYDGVYFSLQAIRLYHPEILDEIEFLIIDNHPDGPCSAALKDLEKHIPNLRYVPAGDVTGTAVSKNRVFSEAGGEFVLCMDCHVLFAPGSLRQLIDYFRSVPLSRDLIQGPMIYDNLTRISTHWVDGWKSGMFGQWANDPAGTDPGNPPFVIPFQGLGVFACRRDSWLGFNPAFRGFGGEEGYIHERFRLAGGRVLCLSALRWLHRFGRPMGSPYPNKWEDRIRNYLIGFREVGWNTDEMQAHFRELLGTQKADRIFAAIRKELDGSAEFNVEVRDDASGNGTHPQRSEFRGFDDDEQYNLREARLQFVAEVAVPVLLGKFTFDSAACVGRGAAIWAREFSRYGISPTVIESFPSAQSKDGGALAKAPAGTESARQARSANLVCCFEVGGISSAALAEQCVASLTNMAPVVVFAFAQTPAGDSHHNNRLLASWAALFAKRGYKAIDCIRPALGNDPRVEAHYQQNIVVFSLQQARESDTAEGNIVRLRTPSPGTQGQGVSVIMPVYNGAAFLSPAIESILLQTYRNFELIIVNDGSTDNSAAIADSYARVDGRVRVLHQDQRGEAAASNAGVANARFALLARLDHDDVALPERLALQVAFMETHEDIAVVGGSLRYIDGDGNLTGGKLTYPLTPEACHAALVNTTVGPIGNPSAMIRKAAFEKIGGCRTQFQGASDFDLWLRMDEHFKLANLPDVLVDYRLHGSNLTFKKRFNQALQAQIAKQAVLLRRRGLPDPIDGWTRLELDNLATFPMPDEEKSQVYRELFDAALSNFAATNDDMYLKLADNCLDQIPVGLPAS